MDIQFRDTHPDIIIKEHIIRDFEWDEIGEKRECLHFQATLSRKGNTKYDQVKCTLIYYDAEENFLGIDKQADPIGSYMKDSLIPVDIPLTIPAETETVFCKLEFIQEPKDFLYYTFRITTLLLIGVLVTWLANAWQT